MESIQWMVPVDSPLIALAQQGVEVASNIIATAPMAENHRVSPLVVTDQLIGQKELKLKQHPWLVAIGVWPTMTPIDR
jgi:hypothetical protein